MSAGAGWRWWALEGCARRPEQRIGRDPAWLIGPATEDAIPNKTLTLSFALAVGAQHVVDAFKGPGDTQRDFIPLAAIALITATDTGAASFTVTYCPNTDQEFVFDVPYPRRATYKSIA